MEKNKRQIIEITADEVQARLLRGDAPLIVDVREDEEVAHGMIPDAIHIPLAELDAWLNDWELDDEIVFVCRTGRRSAVACEQLTARGFVNVKNFVGGMFAWKGDLA
ncbi:MAG: rhodanese-like domain-containing protein [Tumebacillaceae bacterium]